MESRMKGASVLIVPACERGRGGGHLIRSLLILQALQANGRDAFFWVPDYLKDDFLQRFREFFNFLDSPRLFSREDDLKSRRWDFMVLDRFKTNRKEFEFFSGFAPVIGIDEGGPFRNHFDFLIDLLPSLEKTGPNLFSPSLLSLPRNRRPEDAGETTPTSPFRILISFGAEDSAGLGIAAARSLSGFLAKFSKSDRPLEVTLVSPIPPHDSHGDLEEVPGINVMGRIPHLRERLAEYDLLVTHFGLGAFEAVYARLPVLLVSPGLYHERLSRKAGFFSLGVGVEAAGRLGKLARDFGGTSKPDVLETLERKSREIADRYGLWEDQKETIASFLCRVSPRSPLVCPICGKPRAVPALARFPEESYRQCPRCGIIYLARLDEPPIEYEKDYFFSDYKKQYGKTYLEDFPGLVETGKRRLEHIKSLLHYEKPSILDIGCAYGPFLAAAAQCGFFPSGVEPAPDAARYVREELGFPCYQGFFPATDPCEIRSLYSDGSGGFDAVTLWYVIEHFEEAGKVLTEIHGLLKEGGALAFSTPSFSGISGRKSLASFLKNSPPDHFTVWSPKICAWILGRYGFRLRKIVITGHHPERFPLLGGFADPAKKGIIFRFLLFVSRFFRLGDTFEVYAVKA